MRISRFAVVQLALVLSAIAVVAVGAQSAHLVVPADKIQWGAAPPVLPPGAEISVLEGNPAEKGPVTLRLKFPANYEIPAHWHTNTERITVMSGTFNIGMGDRLDRQTSQALQAGGYVSLPGKMHHFAWTKVATVVQLNLEGPFDIFYINAAEDPQKQVTRR
jgi:ChrR-like protein with cupin domain